jgi:hypothetical protein
MLQEHLTLQKTAIILLVPEIATLHLGQRQHRQDLGLHGHPGRLTEAVDEVHDHALKSVQDHCGAHLTVIDAGGRSTMEGEV